MSRFFSSKYKNLEPYVPGEQPRDMKYIKLNTNESPFEPSEAVKNAAAKEAGKLQLYSDPSLKSLCNAIASRYGVMPSQVTAGNGSDEILNFSFMAFCDKAHPVCFPDITYGFYPVFAEINGIPYKEIPLGNDFTVNYKDYCGINANIVIANPNAPTGIALELWQIEEIVKTNPDNIVIIDEAYVDFGAQSAVGLINKYDNIIVTQTFSKSRSMAGARLGFAIANEDIINDINTIRFSTNPYNVNRMTMECGTAALEDNDYYMNNCKKIMSVREHTKSALENLGFDVLPSQANFLFARSKYISGKSLYEKLKKNGILIRHFDKYKIKDYNRITIGTEEQMNTFINAVKKITEDNI